MTLWRGVNKASHELFCFLNSDIKAFTRKMSSLIEQDFALKDTFFLIQFTIRWLEVSENSNQKIKMSHWGRGGGSKKCHVLFEWTLSSEYKQLKIPVLSPITESSNLYSLVNYRQLAMKEKLVRVSRRQWCFIIIWKINQAKSNHDQCFVSWALQLVN